MTKKVSVEQFLTWAFTQELCKVGSGSGGSFVSGSSWEMVSDLFTLGTIIDRSPNHFGVIPDFIAADDEPHPDAMTAGAAVRKLAERGGFEIGQGWNPFPEWIDDRGLIAAEVAVAVEMLSMKRDVLNAKHVVNLVISCAILGKRPDWHAVQPAERLVTKFGKPAWFIQLKARDSLRRSYTYEADGFDRKRQKPMRGAYQKYELEEPIRGSIISRLEWQLWQDALFLLREELADQLIAHELAPHVPVRSPWLIFNPNSNSSEAFENA